MTNGTTELQHNFLHYSVTTHQLNFPMIQTSFAQPQTLSEFGQVKWFNLSFSQSDLQYITVIYGETLTPLKHGQICTMQIPVLAEFHHKSIEMYFYLSKKYLEVNTYRMTYYANFVIFQTSISNPSIKEIYNQVVDIIPSSHIFILNRFDSRVFVPCTPSSQDCLIKIWDFQCLKFVLFDKSITSVDQKSLWNNIYSTKKVSTTLWSIGHGGFRNQWVPELLCPFTKLKLNDWSKYRKPDIKACTILIIGASINCTSEYCKEYIVHSNNFNYGGKPMQHFYLFGVQFHGFRFSVFINKQRDRIENVDLNAFQLLSPLGIFGLLILDSTQV